MKTKYRGKVPGTAGYKSQTDYDIFLSEQDISSLKFLKSKYNRDIRDFTNSHDLHDEYNQQKYQELLQRKKMITEELKQRMLDMYASQSSQERYDYFDPETGFIIDEYGNIKYGLYLTEDEDDITYNHTNNSMNSNTKHKNNNDETDYKYYKYHNRKGVYEDWNYQDKLDE